MLSIKKIISRVDTNLLGLFLSDKIVIIESDDWGSIRIPSLSTRDKLISLGYPLHEEMFTMKDGLEKDEDIKLLKEVLCSHKDIFGNNPILTMNMVMFNPNFKEIKKNNFKKYISESIEKTYLEFENSSNVINLIKSGYNDKVFMPQFHGREHVNVDLWMEKLQTKKDLFGFKEAFNLNVFGLTRKATFKNEPHIQATYDTNNTKFVNSSINDGVKEFRRIFGFVPETFIPNNYVWNPEWNYLLIQNNIKGIQGMKYHLLPLKNNEKRKKLRLKLSIDNDKITYLIRNCDFEQNDVNFNLKNTLFEISLAFKMKKPAIISSHRINYSSRLGNDIRDIGLENLNKLIKEILKRWPDVMFMSSNSLVDMLNKKNE